MKILLAHFFQIMTTVAPPSPPETQIQITSTFQRLKNFIIIFFARFFKKIKRLRRVWNLELENGFLISCSDVKLACRSACVCMCMCMSGRVNEREKERERGYHKRDSWWDNPQKDPYFPHRKKRSSLELFNVNNS